MNDIDKLARTIKADAVEAGAVEDIEKINEKDYFGWFAREMPDHTRGGSNE